ncbi:7583_t:CDS:2, partial [Dentiscutata erythropus]
IIYHKSYLKKIKEYGNQVSETGRKRCASETGVNSQSILFELKATKFSRSFPLDIMHLLFEGVSSWMYKHWNGIFFSNSELNNAKTEHHIMPKWIWEKIGEIMDKNKNNKTMPSEF